MCYSAKSVTYNMLINCLTNIRQFIYIQTMTQGKLFANFNEHNLIREDGEKRPPHERTGNFIILIIILPALFFFKTIVFSVRS